MIAQQKYNAIIEDAIGFQIFEEGFHFCVHPGWRIDVIVAEGVHPEYPETWD